MSIHVRRPTDAGHTVPAGDDALRGGTGAGANAGRRLLVGGLVLAAVVAAAAAAISFGLSGVDVAAGDSGLAKVELGTLAGTLVSATAHGPRGGAIPVTTHDGQVTPLRHLVPGTSLTVTVRVRRPRWSGWALGNEVQREVTIRIPRADVQTHWTTLHAGAPLRVAFSAPVTRLAYGAAGHLRHVQLRHPQRVVSLGRQAPAGALLVSGAPRTWEQLPTPRTVTWFPTGASTLAVTSPPPGGRLGPLSPVRLTFSKPLGRGGSAQPTFAAPVVGHWHHTDSHTLVFTPTGTGFGLGAHVQMALPSGVALIGGGATPTTASTPAESAASWTVPPGSTLRLHELLAQLGYLPLAWHASGKAVGPGDGAQLAAAVDPPKGSFAWRWSLPSQLTSQWNASTPSAITRGALMAFQRDRGLATDGIAGPSVWSALFAALRGHQVNAQGYSYVLVHRDSVAQTATLIHDGKTLITTPANTGVPAAPTQLGTFPVYLRYDVTTMAGTNPDGSRYSDPGIRYVSYFNGGDALHAFNRASFGTPQSVGCVELPESAAAAIYPHTPIGTLVQVAP